MAIQIVVEGTPRPGGSKTPGKTKSGKLFVRDANPLTAVWRAEVAKAAKQQYSGDLLDGPVMMRIHFRFARPKSHFKKNGELKETAPYWYTIRPDLTKVIRSTEDALTGIVWKDDARVCSRAEQKRYCNLGEAPGTTMFIWEA